MSATKIVNLQVERLFGNTYTIADPRYKDILCKKVKTRYEMDAINAIRDLCKEKGITINMTERVIDYNATSSSILIPRIEGASLLELIEANAAPKFDANNVCALLREFRKLHSLNYAHRDIKPSNIMVSKSASNSTKVKFHIIDFEYATPCTNGQARSNNGEVPGSFKYGAPELHRNVGTYYDAYGADIYTLGITLYVWRYKTFPYDVEAITFKDTIDSIVKRYSQEIACIHIRRYMKANVSYSNFCEMFSLYSRVKLKTLHESLCGVTKYKLKECLSSINCMSRDQLYMNKCGVKLDPRCVMSKMIDPLCWRRYDISEIIDIIEKNNKKCK